MSKQICMAISKPVGEMDRITATKIALELTKRQLDHLVPRGIELSKKMRNRLVMPKPFKGKGKIRLYYQIFNTLNHWAYNKFDTRDSVTNFYDPNTYDDLNDYWNMQCGTSATFEIFVSPELNRHPELEFTFTEMEYRSFRREVLGLVSEIEKINKKLGSTINLLQTFSSVEEAILVIPELEPYIHKPDEKT